MGLRSGTSVSQNPSFFIFSLPLSGSGYISLLTVVCACNFKSEKIQFRLLTSPVYVTHLISPVKGYPVIDGALLTSDVVFARFTANSEDCPYKTFAIGNNPQSPDAVHPAVMTTTTLLNCHPDSLVFFHDPNPDWINQEVHTPRSFIPTFLSRDYVFFLLSVLLHSSLLLQFSLSSHAFSWHHFSLYLDPK